MKIASTGYIWTGAGNWGNADTPFYAGVNGYFSIGDALTWDGSTLTITGNDSSHLATEEYVQSRGENLVTNGYAFLGDVNWTAFDGGVIQDDVYAGFGSFKSISHQTIYSEEYIAVTPGKQYYYSYAVKQLSGPDDGQGRTMASLLRTTRTTTPSRQHR